jgi:uncharacterized protein YukE
MVDEKMVYGSMEAMAKAFKDAQKQLNETKSAMKGASKILSGGGLLGKGGDSFNHAIDVTLQKKLDRLIAMLADLEKDINKSVEKNRQVVEQSKKGF